MTTIAHDQAHNQPRPLTFMRSMRIAWWTWFVGLVIPFSVFLVAVIAMNMNDDPDRVRPRLGSAWFLFNMAYLAVSVPLAFFLRSRLFRKYYDGQGVEPRKYLLGMTVVWAVLVIGGILSMLGTYAAFMFAPNIIPALVAFVLYLTQWPKGHAMVRPTGNQDDFEQYEEPR